MEMLGIDLRELVLKASGRGVKLFLGFRRDGSFELAAFRNDRVVAQKIEPWSISHSELNQGDWFNQIVDGMIRRLDDAEKELIETGGYKNERTVY